MVRHMTAAELKMRARLRADRGSMHPRRFTRYRPKWDWKGMIGSAACIKWGFRDLENLDSTLPLFSGRKLAVQAGGNIGLFAKRLAEEFETVVTFEPDTDLFRALKINAPESNIVAHQKALGDKTGGVSLSAERRDNSGRAAHEGLTHVSGSGTIPMVRLDDYKYPCLDLLYLDIEGYELKALRGAGETIARCRPVIGVEINRNIEFYGDSAADLRGMLSDLEYLCVLKRNSDEIFMPKELVQ